MILSFWRAARRGDVIARWDASTTFVVLVAGVLILPTAFTQFSGGLQSYIAANGDLIVLPNARSGQLALLSAPVIIVAGVAFFVAGLARRRPIFIPPLIGLLIVVVTDFSSALSGASTLGAPRMVALASIFLAASVLPRGRGAQLGIAVVGLSVGLLSTILMLTDFSASVKNCRLDKCGPLGNLVLGITNGENVLGILLAASISAAALIVRGRARYVLVLYLVAMVWLSGSRTATTTAVVIGALVFLVRIGGESMPTKVQSRVIFGALTAGVSIGVLLPWTPLTSGEFTGRGDLWELAKSEIASSPVFGFGGLTWGNQVSIGALTRDEAYSVHNQWLDILYTSGAVGVFLFALMLVMGIAGSARGYRSVSALLLAPMVFTGILERVWAFGLLDVWGWLAAATILAFPPAAVQGTQIAEVRERSPKAKDSDRSGRSEDSHAGPRSAR